MSVSNHVSNSGLSVGHFLHVRNCWDIPCANLAFLYNILSVEVFKNRIYNCSLHRVTKGMPRQICQNKVEASLQAPGSIFLWPLSQGDFISRFVWCQRTSLWQKKNRPLLASGFFINRGNILLDLVNT